MADGELGNDDHALGSASASNFVVIFLVVLSDVKVLGSSWFGLSGVIACVLCRCPDPTNRSRLFCLS